MSQHSLLLDRPTMDVYVDSRTADPGVGNGNFDLEHLSSPLSADNGNRHGSPAVGAFSTRDGDTVRKTLIAVIDANTLSRRCLMQSLAESDAGFTTEGYLNVEEWLQAAAHELECIVLLCATGQKSTQLAVRRNVDIIIEAAPHARVIVVSDFEAPAEIVGAVERGAKGFISMSSTFEVAIAAIHVIKAGGTFIPAAGLMPGFDRSLRALEVEPERKSIFTERQIEVLRRVRKGEANKVIAYQLKMGECTVKVHVRNIMRVLKARNRTEIAFLTNDFFAQEKDGEESSR